MVYFTSAMATYLAEKVIENYNDLMPSTRRSNSRMESHQAWTALTDEMNRKYNADFTFKQIKEKWHGLRKEARQGLHRTTEAKSSLDGLRDKPAIRIIKELLSKKDGDRELTSIAKRGRPQNTPRKNIKSDENIEDEPEEYTPTPKRSFAHEISSPAQSSLESTPNNNTDLAMATAISMTNLQRTLLEQHFQNETSLQNSELKTSLPTSINEELESRLLEQELQNEAATNVDLLTTISASLSNTDLQRRLLKQQLQNEQLEYENKQKISGILDTAKLLMNSAIPLLRKMDAFYSQNPQQPNHAHAASAYRNVDGIDNNHCFDQGQQLARPHNQQQ